MIVQVGNPACPTARAGCSSSESMLNFRLELLRQAMGERRRLKDSRARSQAIATQYGSFSRSASKGYRPYVHETSYLLAFAWLQVTRSVRGPGGPRADRVTCNHAKANSNLSSAQGRYLACFTRSRYEHKMRSNLAPCFTLTFQFEAVMC